jgi:membrane fusion protein (multidrug efflux system)
VDTILVRFSITESQYLALIRFEDVQQDIETKDYRQNNLRLILADGSVHEYPGSLDFADRSINPNTGALLLQASFPNPKRILKPGQFAKVHALLHTEKDGIWIPQRCITELQGIHQVMVVKEDNTLELRTVETGPKIGNMWTIASGLKAGEKIILEGLQLARSGMKIDPVVSDFKIIKEDI